MQFLDYFQTDAQDKLWRHMRKDCVIRLVSKDDYTNREQILDRIRNDVLEGKYSPKPLHGFLSNPKNQGVSRFVPVINFEDMAVYFACVKAVDEKLASLRVKNTFGGWSLGGKTFLKEDEEANELFSDMEDVIPPDDDIYFDIGVSAPVSSFNHFAWVKNWNYFWKLLAASYSLSDFNFYISLDIANFYDTINLIKLEKEIRSECHEEILAVEILFFFLSTWNKELNRYSRTSKGIPQDIIGDCSRVLANFYLVSFDREMRKKALGSNSDYFRYADDMVITCNDEKQCSDLVFFASQELHKLGLNINATKVRFDTSARFNERWGFDVMYDLESNDINTISSGLDKLKNHWYNENYDRKYTALKNAISILLRHPDLDNWRKWAYLTSTSSIDDIIHYNHRQLNNIISISDDPALAIDELSSSILRTPFSHPKACLLRCLEKYQKHNNQRVKENANYVISAIDKLNDPILKLTIGNKI